LLEQVTHAEIDGLERIVPIALAVADKMCAGDEVRPYRGKQAFDLLGHALLPRCHIERVLAPPGELLVEKACPNLPLCKA